MVSGPVKSQALPHKPHHLPGQQLLTHGTRAALPRYVQVQKNRYHFQFQRLGEPPYASHICGTVITPR